MAKCKLCGNGDLELFDSRNNLNMYICKECYVITTGVFLSDEEQKNDSIVFYQNNLDWEIVEQEIESNIQLFKNLKIYMNNINKKTILDFGCGNGYFVQAAKRQGIKKAIGIDVNIDEAQRINAHYNNVAEFYTSCDLLDKSNKVDYVVFWHVLEHLENPSMFLEILLPILSDTAMLFIQVPQYKKEYVVKSHYWFYSIPAMKIFLHRHGFIIEKYEFDNGNEFFQVIAKRKKGLVQDINAVSKWKRFLKF